MLRCRLHPSPPSKKYVCKQTFDCCRECNHPFYTCISMAGYTYGACMRGAYKCMCDCIYIGQKSYSELPYKLQHYPILINPPPLHPLRNPEYWYSSLQPGSMWMRPLELYFLHVQYNFKQLPLCESCCPECWQELLISLVLFLNIFFWIIWAASSFLSFFLFFFLFLLIHHKTLFDKVTGVGYRTIFVIYVIQLAKSINCLIYI